MINARIIIFLLQVDDERIGWLPFEDLFIALKGVNRALTDAEEEYMYRVNSTTNIKLMGPC